MREILDAFGDREFRSGPTVQLDPITLVQDHEPEREAGRGVPQQRRVEIRSGGTTYDRSRLQRRRRTGVSDEVLQR